MQGQCHKYKGYDILPMKIITLLESTYLLKSALLPAKIIKAAPRVV
jgi:hypothetical protein